MKENCKFDLQTSTIFLKKIWIKKKRERVKEQNLNKEKREIGKEQKLEYKKCNPVLKLTIRTQETQILQNFIWVIFWKKQSNGGIIAEKLSKDKLKKIDIGINVVSAQY